MGEIRVDTSSLIWHKPIVNQGAHTKTIRPEPIKPVQNTLKEKTTQHIEEAEYSELPEKKKLNHIDIYV